MSKKKGKLEPVIIVSREGMQAVAAELVATKLRLLRLKTKMESEKARIEKEYQGEFDDLTRSIQMAEGGLNVWSSTHPEEFGDKKSIELPSCVFGFRTCPPKVDKVKGAGTWDEVLARLAAVLIVETDPLSGEERVIFRGEDYIRYSNPEVDKNAILRDRRIIAESGLHAAGIVID